MQFIDYYDILQVNRNAEQEVIRAAYRQLCKIYHPDSSGMSEDRIKLINEAFEILSNADKKFKYDIEWDLKIQQYNFIKNSNSTQNVPEFANTQDNTPQGSEKGVYIFSICILFIIIIVGAIGYMNSPAYLDNDNNIISDASVSSSNEFNEEDIAKTETNISVYSSGEAFINVYNGTDFVIDGMVIQISLKNDKDEIVSTRDFNVNIQVPPLAAGDSSIDTGFTSGLTEEEMRSIFGDRWIFTASTYTNNANCKVIKIIKGI